MKHFISLLNTLVLSLVFGAGVFAQASANVSTSGLTYGGGYDAVSSATIQSAHFSGGGAGDASSANFSSSTGKTFSLPGAGTQINYWLGGVSNDALDGNNWSEGLPSATNPASQVVIQPHANSPVLASGTLAMESLVVLDGAVLSVTGTGTLELGSPALSGALAVESGGLLDLSGTATLRDATGSAGMLINVQGGLNIAGSVEGAGVTIDGLVSTGVFLAGSEMLSVENLTLVNGQSGGTMIDYARSDNHTFVGVVFPDLSFAPGSGGFNISATGSGQLTIENNTFLGDGWGEDFDDDVVGSVIWIDNTGTTSGGGEAPQLVVTQGVSQPTFFTTLNASQGVVVGQWRFTAQDGAAALAGLNFSATGTANEATAVSRMRLFRDLNGNGSREANEPQLGSAVTSFTDNGTVSFSFTKINLTGGAFARALLVADLAGTALQAQTLQYRLASPSAVVSVAPTGANDPTPVGGLFPIVGSNITLGVTAQPRIGTVVLDSTTAFVGATGVLATTTVKNVGGGTMDLDSATVRAISPSGVATTLATNAIFSPAQIAPGVSSNVSLSFDLSAAILADLYVIDLQVVGTDTGISVQVSDYEATLPANLNVIDSLAITTAVLPLATEGSPYGAVVDFQGGLAPVTFSLVNGTVLPDGLSFDESGLIVGNPQEEGDFPFDVQALDLSGQVANASLTLSVNPKPVSSGAGAASGGQAGEGFVQNAAIYTLSLPGAVLGESYFVQLSGAPLGGTWQLASESVLPSGLFLAASGDISGTPEEAGTFEFSIRLDAGGSFASEPYTLEVFDPATFGSGAPPIPFGAASGLNLDQASSPSLLSGVVGNVQVSAASVSSDPVLDFVDLVSTDSDGPRLVAAFYEDANANDSVDEGDILRLEMSEAMLFGTGLLTDFSLDSGAFGTGAQLAAGDASSIFEVVLGDGASLTVGTTQVSVAAGALIKDLAGNFAVASSAVIESASLAETDILLLTLNGEPIEEFSIVGIEWSTRPIEDDWTIDIDLYQYGQLLMSIAASEPDTGRYEWSVPTGLVGDGYEIVIIGHNNTLVQDFDDRSIQPFNIVTPGTLDNGNPLLAIDNSSIDQAEVGLSYNELFVASGGDAPYEWSISSGSVPSGLSLDTASGALTGVPLLAGTFAFSLSVEDEIGNAATKAFSLTVYDALQLTTYVLPSAEVGQSYTATIASLGGRAPIQWSLVSGSLPAGLGLNNSQQNLTTISGIAPGSSTDSSFVVRVSDSFGVIRMRQFQLNVTGGSPLIGTNGRTLVEVDPTSGASISIASRGIGGFHDLQGMTFLSGDELLASDGLTGQLVSLDVTSGVATGLGTIGWDAVEGLAYDNLFGDLYAVDQARAELIELDPTNGAGSLIGSLAGFDFSSLAFSSASGMLYSVDNISGDLIEINPANAATSAVGAVVGYSDVQGLSYDASLNLLYGYSRGAGKLITISTTDASTVEIGTIALADDFSLAFDGSDLFALAASEATLYGVDTTTAALTVVGAAGLDIADVAFDGLTLFGVHTPLNTLFAIDPVNAGAVPIGALSGVGTIEGLAFDSLNAVLYGSDVDNGELVEIDPATATATSVGSFGAGILDVSGLAYDSTNDILYGIDQTADQLVTIDRTSGAATPVGAGLGFADLRGFGFDPSTSTLYAADALTFELVSISAGGVGTGVGPLGYSISGLAYDSNTLTMRGVDANLSQLLSVDVLATGTASDHALGLSALTSLAHDPVQGLTYGVDDLTNTLYVIDEVLGTSQAIGSLSVTDVQGLAFDPNGAGTLYAVTRTAADLISIDTTTAVVTTIGATGFAGVSGLAFDASGPGVLYASDVATGQLLTLDTSTGAATPVGAFTGGVTNVTGLAYDLGGSVLYGVDADTGELLSINTGTGAATALGPQRVGALSGLASR